MKTDVPNVALVKPFYQFPNGQRKNLEDMNDVELEEAGAQLAEKIAKKERETLVLKRVADEVQRFHKAGLFAKVPDTSPYADLEQAYEEQVEASND